MRSGTTTAWPSAASSSMPRDEPTAYAAEGNDPTSISRVKNESIGSERTRSALEHVRPACVNAICCWTACYPPTTAEDLTQDEMLRLEKLEIHGFKSFYDPAHLTFPAALTAVVGPSGCGKSTICAAIIWVLGENRASHIRGETMDDVIFQGSARRRALSMGEVTLTLGTSNGDSNHPASDEGRITINRRVFRTGESEFRLN